MEECSLGGEDMSRILISLFLSRSTVSLSGGVPAAVEERGYGPPVILSSPAGSYPFEGGSRLGEPRLVLRSFTISRRISLSGSSSTARPLGVIRASLFTRR